MLRPGDDAARLGDEVGKRDAEAQLDLRVFRRRGEECGLEVGAMNHAVGQSVAPPELRQVESWR